MKITDFAKEVSAHEGKIKQVNIAQIKEILRNIDDLLGGVLYKMIRNLKE